jgi:hypothetical protein
VSSSMLLEEGPQALIKQAHRLSHKRCQRDCMGKIIRSLTRRSMNL